MIKRPVRERLRLDGASVQPVDAVQRDFSGGLLGQSISDTYFIIIYYLCAVHYVHDFSYITYV